MHLVPQFLQYASKYSINLMTLGQKLSLSLSLRELFPNIWNMLTLKCPILNAAVTAITLRIDKTKQAMKFSPATRSYPHMCFLSMKIIIKHLKSTSLRAMDRGFQCIQTYQLCWHRCQQSMTSLVHQYPCRGPAHPHQVL